MPELLPVVIFGFNRPEMLQRTLEALRPQRVDRLVIFIDGPRNIGELPTVEACRSLARQVDWVPADLHLSEKNRGFDGLIGNLDLAAQQYPRFVVLEDDCLPMPGFFAFMRQALERYENEKTIFSVGGYQPLPPSYLRDKKTAVIATARFSCWGWGTWRDRWQEIRLYVDRFENLFDGYRQVPAIAGPEVRLIGDSIAAGKPLDVWDYKVMTAALALKKIHLQPVRGLVENIGVGGGSHGSRSGLLRDALFQNRNLSKRLPEDLVWPDAPGLDCEHVEAWNAWVARNRSLAPRRLLGRTRSWMLGKTGKLERLKDVKVLQPALRSLPRRALLAYITYPFHITPDDVRFYRRPEVPQAQALVRVLNRMGYAVDIIDSRDGGFVPASPYHLFIGHASDHFETLAKRLPAAMPKVLLLTRGVGAFSPTAERDRLRALQERRGVMLAPRGGQPGIRLAGALRLASGILDIGGVQEPEAAGISAVQAVDLFTLYDDHFEWCPKDYAAGRGNFLYLAAGKNVGNGLDLLVEAFTGLKQHLYIASPIEEDFAQVYRRELYQSPNIHILPDLPTRSAEFYRLLRSINFSILPACGNDQEQGLVECMSQGLIPVVSREAGPAAAHYGVILDDLSVAGIRREVQRLAELEIQKYHNRAQLVRDAAVTRFSEPRFEANLQQAMERLLQAIQARSWMGEARQR